jgi:hypothetical protein
MSIDTVERDHAELRPGLTRGVIRDGDPIENAIAVARIVTESGVAKKSNHGSVSSFAEWNAKSMSVGYSINALGYGFNLRDITRNLSFKIYLESVDRNWLSEPQDVLDLLLPLPPLGPISDGLLEFAEAAAELAHHRLRERGPVSPLAVLDFRRETREDQMDRLLVRELGADADVKTIRPNRAMLEAMRRIPSKIRCSMVRKPERTSFSASWTAYASPEGDSIPLTRTSDPMESLAILSRLPEGCDWIVE